MKRIHATLLIATFLLVATSAAAQISVPKSISYQGHLTNAGGIDLNDDLPIEVRLYDSLIAGMGSGVDNSHVIYAEMHPAVHVEDGIFRLKIGEGAPLDAKWTELPIDALATKENVYLELWIDGERLSPRQRMGSVPAVIKAQHAKYADELTTIPTITADMMPAYGAGKITSGTFATSQIPSLSTGHFPTGTISASLIPSLSTSKFLVGSGHPKLSTSRLPTSISANKISGISLSPDRFPNSILMNDDVSIGSGTIAHNEMIVLPEEYGSGECQISISLSVMKESAENGMDQLDVSINGSNIVTCKYRSISDSGREKLCDANYIYVCIKGA